MPHTKFQSSSPAAKALGDLVCLQLLCSVLGLPRLNMLWYSLGELFLHFLQKPKELQGLTESSLDVVFQPQKGEPVSEAWKAEQVLPVGSQRGGTAVSQRTSQKATSESPLYKSRSLEGFPF